MERSFAIMFWTFFSVAFIIGTCTTLTIVKVKTKLGTIQGTPKTFGDFTVNRFYGIPYAKPPVGDLRFQKPEEPESFTDTLDATQHGKACIQVHLPTLPGYDVDQMSEDCLFLNIFVPTEKPDKSIGHAVMLFIHGGAFTSGSSREYDATTLAAHGNVIVVTINYRMGVFGFANTGDGAAPGNMGLWDQQMALRWVNKHIGAFRGDNSRVTLFGESAGGVSVSFQTILPQNKGLFHRAIQESGCSLMPLIFSQDSKSAITSLAKLMDCSTETSAEIISCLKKADAEAMIAILQEKAADPVNGLFFMPTVDNDFLKRTPYEILRSLQTTEDLSEEVEFLRSLDMINGMNSHEGTLGVVSFGLTQDLETFSPTRQETVETLIPTIAAIFLGPSTPPAVTNMLIAQYTNWNNPNTPDNNRDEVVQLLGDLWFIAPAIQNSRVHGINNTASNSYMYLFKATTTTHIIPMAGWVNGANHGDELGFVFGFDEDVIASLQLDEPPTIEEWEYNLSYITMTYWSNFAKTGNPNKPTKVEVEWPGYTTEMQRVIAIDKDMSEKSVMDFYFAEKANFLLNVMPTVAQAINSAQETATVSKQSSDTCSKDKDCDLPGP